MGYLQDKVVYLCGAMQMCTDDGVTWRDYIRPRLEKYGITILDPTRKSSKYVDVDEKDEDKEKYLKLIKEEKFDQLKEDFMDIARWDLRSVDKADFLIVGYVPGIPTVGTIDEIVVANMQRKPILLKYDRKLLHKFSAWMVVRVEPKYMFGTWNEIFDLLDKVDGGEIDKNFWTL